MQEHFKPEMRIVAVGNEQALVTFDSAAAYDLNRSPVGLRIPRAFDSIKIQVGDVVDVPDVNCDSKRVYRGSLKLAVHSGGQLTEYDLADLQLKIAALDKPKRGLPAKDFPAILSVASAIRQGASDALARALDTYIDKEGELATVQRLPAGAYSPAVRVVEAPVQTSMSLPGFLKSAVVNRSSANDNLHDAKKFRRQIVAAALATPIVVIGLMWATAKPKPADPIQDAVAQAMLQTPAAAQAQVDLTKETLKQMGLDPGAAGDTGCLAAQ